MLPLLITRRLSARTLLRSGNRQLFSTTTTTTTTVNSNPQLLFMWGTDTKGCLLKPDDRQAESKIDVPALISNYTDTSDNSNSNNNHNTTIASVVCGATDTAILTTDGTCHVMGENKYGQLGLGHTNPVLTPTKLDTINIVTQDNDDNSNAKPAFIQQVSLGPHTGAFVDQDGDLYTCGLAGSALTVGALGLGPNYVNKGNITLPTLVTTLIQDDLCVAKVDCTSELHTTILTTRGEVLTTGHGSYGRLGNLDTIDQLYFEPVELLARDVVDITAGKSFTLALTASNGVIHGWGRNQQGQLGTGYGLAVDMYAMQALPEPIATDELVNRQVIQASAGYAHAVCITSAADNYDVFEWGMSLYLEPTRVREFINKRIVQVSCGQNYTLALDDDGYVYSWGSSGKTGVLGQGGSVKQSSQPLLVEALQDYKVTSLSAGWKHAACLAVER